MSLKSSASLNKKIVPQYPFGFAWDR